MILFKRLSLIILSVNIENDLKIIFVILYYIYNYTILINLKEFKIQLVNMNNMTFLPLI